MDSIKPDAVQSLDIKRILLLGNDLCQVLDTARDFSVLDEVEQEISGCKSAVEKDLSGIQTILKDIQANVLAHERKVEAAEEGVVDEKLQALHTELERELQYEHQFMQELRVIEDEMDRLEVERSRIESVKKVANKAKNEELRPQNELSLFASISRIIPDLSATADKYTGHIVHREKQKVEKFEFDRTKMSGVEICNRLWQMADS